MPSSVVTSALSFAVIFCYRGNCGVVEFACNALSERAPCLGLYAVAEVIARHIVLCHIGVHLNLVYYGADSGIRKQLIYMMRIEVAQTE